MKKILAVSGGVDSMALMRMYRDVPEVVVAHFNHGTRPSSGVDEDFVRFWAKEYGLPFFCGRAELGEGASEEEARISRYEYFEQLASKIGGEIYTAHHADDLIESMAINLIRGTGWRGLTPFSRKNVRRPFIERDSPLFRADILRYAAENEVTFRYDPTNGEEKYLRNRIREGLLGLSGEKKGELVKIYHQMNNLREKIDETTEKMLENGEKYPREWFFDLEEGVALEILRAILEKAEMSATRPQRKDFLEAIKNYPAGRKFNLPRDRFAKIGTKEFFILEK